MSAAAELPKTLPEDLVVGANVVIKWHVTEVHTVQLDCRLVTADEKLYNARGMDRQALGSSGSRTTSAIL